MPCGLRSLCLEFKFHLLRAKDAVLRPSVLPGHGTEQVPATKEARRHHDGPSPSSNLAGEGQWRVLVGRRRLVLPPGMRVGGTRSVHLNNVMTFGFTR